MAILTIIDSEETRIELPNPKSLSWESVEKEGSGSGINQNGDSFKDVVSEKRSLTVTWGVLPQEDTEVILDAVKSETFFTLEFPDPQVGNSTMVVGKSKITMPMLSMIDNTVLWNSLKVKFIER